MPQAETPLKNHSLSSATEAKTLKEAEGWRIIAGSVVEPKSQA
jgi:hypothetical protein